jgi:dTDP-4-amino-4,6-dideoxygalactose transaminase
LSQPAKTHEFMPFAKPTLSKEAIQEVMECLQSGWLTTGPRVQKFETMLCEYFGVPHAPTLTSATAGLHLALLSLDLQPGDEVITTPLTFIATLNTIVQAGGKPVLVDIDPVTYNIDVNLIPAAITKNTRAIVPVHFAGSPVDLDPLYALAEKHNLRVIEDCAHAIGTEYKGKKLGSFGDTQVFSFHPNKNMTTGEGGCLTTTDEALATYINMMKFHGINRAVWNRFSKQGSQHYDVEAPGFKYNMMDIQAALGIHQLPALDGFIEKRTALAARYQAVLAEWPQWILPTGPKYKHKHAWHLFAPTLNVEAAGMDRDAFVAKMKEENIGLGVHYPACHLYTYYRDNYAFKPGDFPHAESVGSRILSLPLFPTMTMVEQDRVIDTMAKIFKTV